MGSSKKQKKRQKAYQKQQQRQAYLSQKRHFEQYQIPPYSSKHLKALLLEYMAHGQFQYPMHHLQMFQHMQKPYKNLRNSQVYMSELASLLPGILKELHLHYIIQLCEKAMGTRLVSIVENINDPDSIIQLALRHRLQRPMEPPPDVATFQQQQRKQMQKLQNHNNVLAESLLSAPSLFFNSQESQRIDLDSQLKQFKTFEEKLQLEEFHRQKDVEYCDHCTRDKCDKARRDKERMMKIGDSNISVSLNSNNNTSHLAPCGKKHFRAILTSNTEESYGNCPHLNACHNPDCRLIHYAEEDLHAEQVAERSLYRQRVELAEWVNCDLRYFDFNILGKFDVVMADPPWDIHMSLPYGTMKDKEMLNLRVDLLQEDGLLFLWVTGRAMELARECMHLWGYRKVDEIVWVKTNQIHRLIITGKTGHWLNHTKQHCLVGVKGNPKINPRVDCDVIVSKVRETSRKPDQIYGIIERMSPGGKKIELFGRPDNCMPGWLTLGNQLTDVRLRDQQIIKKYKQAFPHHDVSAEKMQKNLQDMVHLQNLNKVYNNHLQQQKQQQQEQKG